MGSIGGIGGPSFPIQPPDNKTQTQTWSTYQALFQQLEKTIMTGSDSQVYFLTKQLVADLHSLPSGTPAQNQQIAQALSALGNLESALSNHHYPPTTAQMLTLCAQASQNVHEYFNEAS